MTRSKLPVLVLVVGLSTIAGVVGLLTVPNAAAIDWCTPMVLSMSPSKGYAGDVDPVGISVTNGVNVALQVSEIDVTFGWSSTTWNWGSMSLAAYGSGMNSYSVTLPSTTGDYVTTIVVHGQAAGDWFAATCTFSRTFSVQTLPPAPTVVVTGNPTTGTAPLSVSFSATVSQGLAPFTYYWTFGDGASQGGNYVGASVTHTYQSANTYTAQVVVTDSRGRSASSSVTVIVNPSSGNAGSGGSNNVGPQSTDWTPIIAVVGILVIAAVVVAAVLITRGRRQEAAPPQQPYQPPMPPQT